MSRTAPGIARYDNAMWKCIEHGSSITGKVKPYYRPRTTHGRETIPPNIATWFWCREQHWCLHTLTVGDEGRTYNRGGVGFVLGAYMQEVEMVPEVIHTIMNEVEFDAEAPGAPKDVPQEHVKLLNGCLDQLVGIQKAVWKTGQLEGGRRATLNQQLKGMQKRFEKLIWDPKVSKENRSWWIGYRTEKLTQLRDKLGIPGDSPDTKDAVVLTEDDALALKLYREERAAFDRLVKVRRGDSLREGRSHVEQEDIDIAIREWEERRDAFQTHTGITGGVPLRDFLHRAYGDEVHTVKRHKTHA